MENRNSYLSLREYEKCSFFAGDWYLQCLESKWISPLHGSFSQLHSETGTYLIVELPFSINRVLVLFT
jgi:hypothetical protein